MVVSRADKFSAIVVSHADKYSAIVVTNVEQGHDSK